MPRLLWMRYGQWTLLRWSAHRPGTHHRDRFVSLPENPAEEGERVILSGQFCFRFAFGYPPAGQGGPEQPPVDKPSCQTQRAGLVTREESCRFQSTGAFSLGASLPRLFSLGIAESRRFRGRRSLATDCSMHCHAFICSPGVEGCRIRIFVVTALESVSYPLRSFALSR
jgi:hypothetical protein